MNLFTGLEEIITENEPLAKFTWLNIGGPAEFFAKPKTEDQLKTLVIRCKENNIPFRILGQGANILINDKGIKGLVIKLDETGFGEMKFDNHSVQAGAACTLGSVIRESIKKGMGGMEELVGIPGTIGGAVKGNAGSKFADIGTITSSVTVIDNTGTIYTREKPELVFEYRKSNISSQIITQVTFELVPDDPNRLLNRMKETFIIKKNSQPLSSRSAGCIFKNPPNEKPAGLLIDRAGLKGTQIGGAMISDRHANFIVNQGNATFDDIRKLIDTIRNKVFEQFGIELKLEIEIWE